jgi:hypothetical protein
MLLPVPGRRQKMVYAKRLIGMRSEMPAAIGDRAAMR